ncbi:hypothetical protein EH165_00785 [Nakamurella antarctica]|uniref:Septum formation-related domain-containing protein n=1 Tax=Nakamurella antarctica TaxID=1902245 RepID=A0A3G8ZHR8_9ACTN|nr:hypothetical protein [Nakamurella antarctica]AZI56922.1 hypothetical protein EH165_00785 [Nakamurella antarctica]
MNQRRTGALILAAALLALVVLSAVQQATKPLPGAASAIPIAAPPSVGDCLLEPAGGQGVQLTPTSTVLRPDQVLSVGPCVGLRYGEVVKVTPAITRTDEQDSLCVNLYDYVGVKFSGAGWRTPLYLSSTVIGPDDRQFATGQTWAACVVIPSFGQPYDGSVKGAGSALPPSFATCFPGARTADSLRSDCYGPHRRELLGVRSLLAPGMTQAELDQTCQEWGSKVTGLQDFTVSGQLRPATAVYDSTNLSSTLSPANLPGGQPYYAECFAEPTSLSRLLTGPLLSLGDGPLPLS